MKRHVISTLLCLAPAMSAFAAPPNSVGCGVGSQLFDGQKGVFPQVAAITTNGTLGNQTFGITSGTLGCDSNGTVVASARIPMFVGANLDSLARDMAQGQGESLTTLASLLNITDADETVFYSAAKAQYGDIFSAPSVTAGDVLTGLYRVMAQHPRLSVYVPA